MRYQSIKGTKDILPQESSEWQRIEAIARDIFRPFGYSEIRTPIIEETNLFKKSVGEETDIVKKEMFSFTDRGERDISLRPEGTAPIVRAYLENNLDKTEPFQKLYYMGPMFRAERPQAGRLRQFSQIGIEAIGSNHPALDAEVITVLARLLDSIGIKGYQLRLNNLGCKDDKKNLADNLKSAFSAKGANALLCEDCKRRVKTNPLRILDCKVESCKAAVRDHFNGIDFICPDCKKHFERVLKYLKISGISYKIDNYIVRGLDYYTRTVFEVTHEGLGAQNAIGAGGRYDNLMAEMGGASLGACGFAIGVDRAMMISEKRAGAEAKKMDVFIATLGEEAHEKAFAILHDLRSEGVSCDIDYENKSLKAQMRAADKFNAKFVLILGEDEMKAGSGMFRNMKTKEQASVKFEDVVKEIASALRASQ